MDTTHTLVAFSIDSSSGDSGSSNNGKIDTCGCQDGGAALLYLPFIFMLRRRGKGSRSAVTNHLYHSVLSSR